MLIWPLVIGSSTRAVDWWASSHFGLEPARAVLLASFVAGALLVAAGRRAMLPFSGIGFASVVSMMPGIFVFPMASALVAVARHGPQSNVELVAGAVSDGTTAFLVVLAMAIGLLSPKSFADVVLAKRTTVRRDRSFRSARS